MTKKNLHFTYLKIMGTFAVVALHVSTAALALGDAKHIGIGRYAVYDLIQLLCRWAVPVFIMVSGALLLKPEKEMPLSKILVYIKRMFLVLFVFGSCYALMELIFSSRTVGIHMLPQALLQVLQGRTWTHMWYIYMLIGLYAVTPLLRAAVNHMDAGTMQFTLVILAITSCFIPTVNNLLELNVKNYLEISVYAFYYLLGHYLTRDTNLLRKYSKAIYLLGLVSLAVEAALDIRHVYSKYTRLEWITGLDTIFILFISTAVFLLVNSVALKNQRTDRTTALLDRCSFGIYLIHPFFINLLYKVLDVTPAKFSLFAGWVICYTAVFMLSLTGAYIMTKLPFLKKII